MVYCASISENWSIALLAAMYAVTIILLITAIAFFTILERKILAAVQRRRGPNLVGI